MLLAYIQIMLALIPTKAPTLMAFKFMTFKVLYILVNLKPRLLVSIKAKKLGVSLG